MDITYTLSAEDFVAFNMHYVRHSPTARRAFWKALIAFPLTWMIFWLLLASLGVSEERTLIEMIVAMLPLFLLGPIYVVIFPTMRRRGIRKQVEGYLRESGMDQTPNPHRLTIAPEWIAEANHLGETRRKWAAIREVATSDQHVFL